MKRAAETRPLLFLWMLGATLVALLIAASAALPGPPQPEAQKTRAVTFARDIAPVVFRSCASCHHAGEAGPFPLVTHREGENPQPPIAAVPPTQLIPPPRTPPAGA